MKSRFFSALLFIFFCFKVSAQKKETQPLKDYKNLIRWNLTPTLAFGFGTVSMGYERKVKSHQSFSFNLSVVQFPDLVKDFITKYQINGQDNRYGFGFSGDYRFYSKKRNKRSAPDGLYFGPFINTYVFDTQTELNTINDGTIYSNLNIDTEYNFLMIGAELGYQFTFGKRKNFSLDLVLVGPSLRYDVLSVSVGGKVSEEILNEISDDYLRTMTARILDIIPGFKDITRDSEVTFEGKQAGFGLGYRYIIQFGFRF